MKENTGSNFTWGLALALNTPRNHGLVGDQFGTMESGVFNVGGMGLSACRPVSLLPSTVGC